MVQRNIPNQTSSMEICQSCMNNETHLKVEQLLSNARLELVRLGTIGLHNFLSSGKHDYYLFLCKKLLK